MKKSFVIERSGIKFRIATDHVKFVIAKWVRQAGNREIMGKAECKEPDVFKLHTGIAIAVNNCVRKMISETSNAHHKACQTEVNLLRNNVMFRKPVADLRQE